MSRDILISSGWRLLRDPWISARSDVSSAGQRKMRFDFSLRGNLAGNRVMRGTNAALLFLSVCYSCGGVSSAEHRSHVVSINYCYYLRSKGIFAESGKRAEETSI